MKKIISIIASLALVAAMMFSFSACTDKKEPNTDMENPMTEYSALYEINEVTGMHLTEPICLGMLSDEKFFVIDNGEYKIAEYQFTNNNVKYTYRACSNFENDISGVYEGDGLLIDKVDENGIAVSDTGKIATWTTTDGKYVIYAEDNGQLDYDEFYVLKDELAYFSVPYNTEAPALYARIEGNYADTVSGRAYGTLENYGDCVQIYIHWADSASVDVFWSMTAKLGETDGLLNYNDCVKIITEYDENGEIVSTTPEQIDPSGYFSIDENDALHWDGAAEENCRSCIFEKDGSVG